VSTAFVTTLVGISFGAALAAPPGPINALIAEESVLRGWVAGFRTGVAAMLADVLFFVLTLAGVATILQRYEAVQDLLFVAGGVLMLVFAFDAARDATTAGGFLDGDIPAGGTGFRKAFVLSLSNPYQLTFWLTAGVGLVRPGTLAVAQYTPQPIATLFEGVAIQTGSPLLLFGFFGGILLWVTVYPAALVVVGKRIDAFAPVVGTASAAVLFGFGLLFCWIGITSLGDAIPLT